MLNKKPFLIGVAGGISSGKSTVCRKIIDEIGKLNNQHKKNVLVISLDSFYRKLSSDELQRAERGDHNLDHPGSFDEEAAYHTLISLIEGKSTVEIPLYNKKAYKCTGELLRIRADQIPDVVIIEGILVFYYPKIRDLCKMKLFVDCDADTRLSRRVMRDIAEYKRPLEHILNYYQKFVKPAFEEFCLPTKKYADVIIPRGVENTVAIDLIVQHLNDYLNSNTGVNRARVTAVAAAATATAAAGSTATFDLGHQPATTSVEVTPAGDDNDSGNGNVNGGDTLSCLLQPKSPQTSTVEQLCGSETAAKPPLSRHSSLGSVGSAAASPLAASNGSSAASGLSSLGSTPTKRGETSSRPH